MPDPNNTYHHTQAGFVIIGAFAIGMLIMVLGARNVTNTTPTGATRTGIFGLVTAVAICVTIVSFLFSSLTIEIRDGELRWHFTAGVIHGSVRLRDIVEVTQVRSSAAYGWGLRKTPEGTLYSVSGLNAVRVRTRDGHQFNFGSDEPTRLARSLEEAIEVR